MPEHVPDPGGGKNQPQAGRRRQLPHLGAVAEAVLVKTLSGAGMKLSQVVTLAILPPIPDTLARTVDAPGNVTMAAGSLGSAKVTRDEASVITPNPPTWISTAMTICPNGVQVSTVLRPVTQMADVAVKEGLDVASCEARIVLPFFPASVAIGRPRETMGS